MSDICREGREFVQTHQQNISDAGDVFQQAYGLVDGLSKRLNQAEVFMHDVAAELRQLPGEHSRKVLAAVEAWQASVV